jgi:hypothetical protein
MRTRNIFRDHKKQNPRENARSQMERRFHNFKSGKMPSEQPARTTRKFISTVLVMS